MNNQPLFEGPAPAHVGHGDVLVIVQRLCEPDRFLLE